MSFLPGCATQGSLSRDLFGIGCPVQASVCVKVRKTRTKTALCITSEPNEQEFISRLVL